MCFYSYIKEAKSVKKDPSGVANCRNLPFGERATRDSRVRVPRKEYVRSRHQCLFEETSQQIHQGAELT